MLVSRYYFDFAPTFRSAIDTVSAIEVMPYVADHQNQCIVVPFADSERTEAALSKASLRVGTFVRGAEASEDEQILGTPSSGQVDVDDMQDDGTWVPSWKAYV
jgi:hypothetical protein